MTPAPTMVTSACRARSAVCAELHHPDVLEDELQRCQAGHVPDVEGWRDFVHVETGQTHAAQLAKEIQQLARRQAACRQYPGSRGVRRVQRIDIERDMERVGADPRPDLARPFGTG